MTNQIILKILTAATVKKAVLGAKSCVLEVAVFRNHMVPPSPARKQHVSQNYWYLSIIVHGVISLNIKVTIGKSVAL
jgi:hypothetical protein